jgi:hypothetical protein
VAGPRAYALAVAELRGLVGPTGTFAQRVRALAEQAFAPDPRPLRVPDAIGPLYRRVPGTPVVRADDPTPADLDRLLAGEAVPAERAAATWRLLEAVVAGLAWSSTPVDPAGLPPGLLSPLGLPLPAVGGLTVGWCRVGRAVAVPGLAGWLADRDGWARAAAQARRPAPDVVVLGRA